MNELFTAIYTKFTTPASDLYTRIGGRLYLGEAPQKADYPHAVYFLVSSVPDWDFGAIMNFDEAVIQFNLFSEKNSASEVNNMWADLMSLYDWCTLSPGGGYTSLYMRREFSNLFRDTEEGIWMYSVQYRILFQS